MSSRLRLVLFILAGIAVLALTTVGAAGVAVYRAGTIHVQFSDSGTDLSVSVPASLVDTALAFAPWCVPDDALRDVAREVDPYWPAIEVLLEDLQRTPDATYFELTGPREQIEISKRDGRFHFRMVSDHEHVEVSVPEATVERMASALERLLRRSA